MPAQGKSGTSSRTGTARGKRSSSTRRSTRQTGREQTGGLGPAEHEALAWSVTPKRPSGQHVTGEEISTAVDLAERLDRPVRIPPERRLETGLCDYAMWQRILSAAPAPPPLPADARTGRIWA